MQHFLSSSSKRWAYLHKSGNAQTVTLNSKRRGRCTAGLCETLSKAVSRLRNRLISGNIYSDPNVGKQLLVFFFIIWSYNCFVGEVIFWGLIGVVGILESIR